MKELKTNKYSYVVNYLEFTCYWNNKKAYSRLVLLRRVKYILDRTLLKLYFSFIRPFVEYADIIWENILDYLVMKIENIQL